MNQNILNEYQKLNEPEKSVLELSALFYFPVKHQTLFKTYNRYLSFAKKPRIKRNDFDQILKALHQKSFFKSFTNTKSKIKNEQSELIARKIIRSGHGKKLVKAIRTERPLDLKPGTNEILVVLHFRLAIYTGDRKTIEEIIGSTYFIHHSSVLLDLLMQIIYQEFDAGWFQKLPKDVKGILGNIIIFDKIARIERLETTQPFIEHCTELFLSNPRKSTFRYTHYLDYQFLLGNLDFFLHDTTFSRFSYFSKGKALAIALTDSLEKGIEYFRKILEVEESEIKNSFSQLLFNWYYLLLLLHNPDNKKEILQRFNISNQEYNKTSLLPAFLALRDIASGKRIPDYWPVISSQNTDPYLFLDRIHRILLYGVYLSWTEPEDLIIYTDDIREAFRKTKKSGYHFLAYQLATILNHIKPSKEATGYLKTHKLVGSPVALMSLRSPRPHWERVLEEIETVLNRQTEVAENEPVKEERLVWVIEKEQEEYYSFSTISLKLQKKNKNGGWSKGRTINIDEALLEKSHLLTPEDQKLLMRIQNFTGGAVKDIPLYYLGEMLIGHPRIYHKWDLEHPITFTRGQFFVTFEKNKGFIEPILLPEIGRKLPYFHVVSPNRIEIYQPTPQEMDVISILNNEMPRIPASETKFLPRFTETLARVVPVLHSQATPNVQVRQLDRFKMVMRIEPYKEKFLLNLLVRVEIHQPFYFLPGKGARFLTFYQNEKLNYFKRNLTGEKELAKQILDACPQLAYYREEEEEYSWIIPSAEKALPVFARLEELSEILTLEWPRNFQLRIQSQVDFSRLKLQLSSGQDWFGISGNVRIDENLVVTFRELLEKFRQSGTQEFIEISPGRLIQLTREMVEFMQKVNALSTAEGEEFRIHRFAAAAFREIDAIVPPEQQEAQWRNFLEKLKHAENIDPKVPKGFRGTLRPYQEEGYRWLSRLAAWGAGACLADDMGLGKTIQALALILSRAEGGATLVIAPASVVHNWAQEAQRFTPKLRPIVLSNQDEVKAYSEPQPYDLVLCNYHIFQRHGEHFLKHTWQTIVLDEAQMIKNITTKRTRMALKLNGHFKMITTGTPIENHLIELWTLFQFILPGLLGSWKHFNEHVVGPIVRNKDEGVRDRLKQVIRPFILRRLKQDVMKELPPKTEVNLSIELSPEEMAFYQALREKALENLADVHDSSNGQTRIRVLAEIMRLRRACCHPRLVEPAVDIPGTKIQVLKDLLQELIENRHKTLIFSQFTDFLKIVEAEIREMGIPYQYLDGQTPVRQRRQRIEAFQNGEGEVFLISLRAGGLGLNLTAANYVIHLDPWWNPAVEDQASDRAHRIGQTRPVTIYRFITRNTIEEKILDLHQQKRDLAHSLLEGTDTAGVVSVDELLALLQHDIPERIKIVN